MTISRIARRCAYHTGTCAILLLAMGTSHATHDCDDVDLIAVADSFTNDPEPGFVSGEQIHLDVLFNDLAVVGDNEPVLIGTHHLDCVARVEMTSFPEFGQADGAEADSAVNRDHVDYTSAPGFGGTETFEYAIVHINDAESAPATVEVLVDGSTSFTPAGATNIAVFGGAAFPGSTAAFSAAIEKTENGGTSKTQCCTVPDPRIVGAKFKSEHFDLGFAMQSGDCQAMHTELGINPPAKNTLIVPRHFRPLGSDKFGVCVVTTDAGPQGAVALDVRPEKIDVDGIAGPDFAEVDCEGPTSIEQQHLVLGLAVTPPEFTSPFMRAITSDCDPRSVTKWSDSYVVANAARVTEKEDSRTYVARMFKKLKELIDAMKGQGAATTDFLQGIKQLVIQADEELKAKTVTPDRAEDAMDILDEATLCALLQPQCLSFPLPPDDPYFPSAKFENPKGELISHLTALRYAVCSELAHDAHEGDLVPFCEMEPAVFNALPFPFLPQAQPSP